MRVLLAGGLACGGRAFAKAKPAADPGPAAPRSGGALT